MKKILILGASLLSLTLASNGYAAAAAAASSAGTHEEIKWPTGKTVRYSNDRPLDSDATCVEIPSSFKESDIEELFSKIPGTGITVMRVEFVEGFPEFWSKLLAGITETKQIVSLFIGASPDGKSIAAALRESLPKSGLESLSLNGNGLGVSGIADLAEGLAGDTVVLRHLRISNDPIGTIGAAALAKGLPRSLESIGFFQANIGPEGAESLGNAFKGLPGLYHVDLSYCGIGDFGVAAVATGLPGTVEVLELRNNGIGPVGAEALSKELSRFDIRYLGLRYNPLKDGALHLGAGLPKRPLGELDLTGTQVTAEGVRGFIEGSTGVRFGHLNLSGNNLWDTARWASALAVLEARVLDLSGSRIDDLAHVLLRIASSDVRTAVMWDNRFLAADFPPQMHKLRRLGLEGEISYKETGPETLPDKSLVKVSQSVLTMDTPKGLKDVILSNLHLSELDLDSLKRTGVSLEGSAK